MPTIHHEDGFRFFFFSNEGNEPPHIHVERGDGYGKFWLRPAALACSANFTRPELRRAREIVERNVEYFLERWNDYFGT